MIQYCTKMTRHCGEGTYFIDIYPSVMQVRMCTDGEVFEVDVEEATEVNDGSYWGWRDPDDSICMIYPEFFLMNICFPDGAKAEEMAGRGRIIRVSVTEIRKVE